MDTIKPRKYYLPLKKSSIIRKNDSESFCFLQMNDQIEIWHAPSYYVQLCQPKCQIYEKTEYFEYATTVLKPN